MQPSLGRCRELSRGEVRQTIGRSCSVHHRSRTGRCLPEMDSAGVLVADGAEHPLRHALSIGRDPDNDIVLAKTTVSRHHAVLTFVEERWLIEDRGSANGTFV